MFSICQRGEYHSTRALIGWSDAGYPVLLLVFASEVNSTLRALWLVHQTPVILYYPPRGAQAWLRALIRLIFEQLSLF